MEDKPLVLSKFAIIGRMKTAVPEAGLFLCLPENDSCFPDEPQLMITAGPGMGMPAQGYQQMPGMYAQQGYGQMPAQGPMPGYGM